MGIQQPTRSRALFSALTGFLLLAAGTAPRAALIESGLSFQSTDQSMWGTGQALQHDSTEFYGTTWNERGSAGGFVGGSTRILNPLWVAWDICPVFCGSEPTKFFTVDTTTGLEVSATSTGRIGFELGTRYDSGSVDALVDYTARLETPQPGRAGAGEFINLNPTSQLTGDSLASQFPTIEASLAVVMEISATFAATGCAVGACGSTSFSTGTLGGTQELVAFNKDGEGGITYFGGEGVLSDLVDLAVDTGQIDLPTGFPAEIAIPAPGLGNIATITAHLPEPNTSGGLDPTGTKLTSIGQDDLLDLSFDIDNIISLSTTGTGGLFGGSVDLGGGFDISYDLINVEMGPQLDLVQSFELTPSLFVDLDFSQPVNVAGHGLVNSVQGLSWDALPDMAFSRGTTTITPTFSLGALIGGDFVRDAADLFNELFLDIDGNVRVDLLTATFGTPFGDESIGLGNLIDESFDLFSTPAIFSDRFAMAGFTPVLGTVFDVTAPEPGILLLLGIGLVVLGAATRTRRRP